jgi:gas vesicle protein
MTRRSLSLIAGLGAAAAAGAYLFSKPKLRKELRKADNPREALDIVGKHLREDSQELASEMKDLALHPRLDQRLGGIGRYFRHSEKATHSAMKETAAKASRKVHEALAQKEISDATAD